MDPNPGTRTPEQRLTDFLVVRNRCDRTKVAVQFAPLIEAAIEAYLAAWPDDVVDIRLLGSVARGEAGVGKTDIDFMAVLSRPAEAKKRERLAERAKTLRQTYPFVTRVELDAEAASDLVEFQQFVLSSDSVSLYGRDELTKPAQTIERVHLAHLVTPDIAGFADGYREMVETAGDDTDPNELRFYSRVIGKDLLKCLRFLILLRGGEYEPSIAGIYRQVATYAPELSSLSDDLYRLYREPTTNREAMLNVLRRAGTTLLAAVQEA